jgi:hypothetical protein
MSPMSVPWQAVFFISSILLQVQHIVPEVTIPPEVTPENVTTYIVDSGGMSSTQCSFLLNSLDLQLVRKIDSTWKPKYGKHM